MYDKVTFRLYRYQIGDAAFDGLRFFCKEGRDVGYMGNIRIEFKRNPKDHSLPAQTVWVSGSIRKWFTSSNVVAPTFNEAVHEINEICCMLRINPQDAGVTGLEFGSTYAVRERPSRYLELMHSFRDSKRSDHAKEKGVETVYFESDTDTDTEKRPSYCHIFYDKGAEERKHSKRDLGYHAVRYEVKIFKRLRTFIKWGESITLATLQDPQFFNAVTKYYLSTYDQIMKLPEIKGGYKVETAKGGVNLFFARIANEYLRTCPNALRNYTEEVKRKNPTISAQTLSRMRSGIKAIVKMSDNDDEQNEGLIKELDQLIYAECQRCAPPEK